MIYFIFLKEGSHVHRVPTLGSFGIKTFWGTPAVLKTHSPESESKEMGEPVTGKMAAGKREREG